MVSITQIGVLYIFVLNGINVIIMDVDVFRFTYI